MRKRPKTSSRRKNRCTSQTFNLSCFCFLPLIHTSSRSLPSAASSFPPSVASLCISWQYCGLCVFSRHKPLWRCTVWTVTDYRGTWKQPERRTPCCRRATLMWEWFLRLLYFSVLFLCPSFHLSVFCFYSLQLQQQVEGWAERVSELEEEMRRFEAAHNGMMQDVANKDERIMVRLVVAWENII